MTRLALGVVCSAALAACSRAPQHHLPCPETTTTVNEKLASGEVESYCIGNRRLRHGPYERVRADGSVAARGFFVSDQPVGQWVWYGDDGNPVLLGSFLAEPVEASALRAPENRRAEVEQQFLARFAGRTRKVGWWYLFDPSEKRWRMSFYADGRAIEGEEVTSPLDGFGAPRNLQQSRQR